MAQPPVHPALAELLRTGFHSEAHEADGTIVVRLQGELDMDSAPGLARDLLRALDADPTAVALDLTELTFLDSCGIRALIVADQRARSQDCGFSLRSPRRQPLKALRLTGVDRLISIVGDGAGAMAPA